MHDDVLPMRVGFWATRVALNNLKTATISSKLQKDPPSHARKNTEKTFAANVM